MQTGNGGFFSFGSGGPYRQDIFERDVLMINALYYDKGYMSVQIGTPRVALTPDREDEIMVAIHEAPAKQIRQLQTLERDDDGKAGRQPGGRRATPGRSTLYSGDHLNRAELVKDFQAARTPYRDGGPRERRGRAGDRVDPVHQEWDIISDSPVDRWFTSNGRDQGNIYTRDMLPGREM